MMTPVEQVVRWAGVLMVAVMLAAVLFSPTCFLLEKKGDRTCIGEESTAEHF